jgi:hypothetical protein
VWALPAQGGKGDFEVLVDLVTSANLAGSGSRPVRFLWNLRKRLGRLLRLDDQPFVPLYRTDDEYASETRNRTVHGILHLGWVDDGGGRYHGELAVYVRPRGLFGQGYMALIKPFRHWIVYPALMRQLDRAWSSRAPRR